MTVDSTSFRSLTISSCVVSGWPTTWDHPHPMRDHLAWTSMVILYIFNFWITTPTVATFSPSSLLMHFSLVQLYNPFPWCSFIFGLAHHVGEVRMEEIDSEDRCALYKKNDIRPGLSVIDQSIDWFYSFCHMYALCIPVRHFTKRWNVKGYSFLHLTCK